MSRRFPKREWTGPYVGWGSLEGNHHGLRGADGERGTLCSTAQVLVLDNGMNPPPRYYWGVRLWIYAPSGRCWSLDVAWRSSRRYAASEIERQRRADLYLEQQKARGKWPPRYDGSSSFLGAMLGASGLGLRMPGE